MLEPADSSALADYSTDEYPEIIADIRGRDRDMVRIPGASQLSGTVARDMPTKSTAGSSYYVPIANRINIVTRSVDFVAYAVNREIFIKVSEPGRLMVYDISGRLLNQLELVIGPNTTTLYESGIYILRFRTESGEVIAKKIACY